MTLRVLIADDEAHLRDWLQQLLRQMQPAVEVIAEAADGQQALHLIDSLKPDIALLDIRMPGLSGLEVARQKTHPCAIAFVTAYNEFAIPAFELAAVDYLLKPVTPERLQTTLERLQAKADTAISPQLLQNLLQQLQPNKSYLRWLKVGHGQHIELLDVGQVSHFEATDKYTVVHGGQREWLLRTPLKELEQQLNPDEFWRIHRSTVVRVAAISRISKDLMGRQWVELNDHPKPLPVSRSYLHLFRQM